jgi:hypothetical protein
MRVDVLRCAVLLLVVWGCGGSSNYFEEAPVPGAGRGGAGHGGMAGASGSTSGRGGAGGSTSGRGGVGGTSGGTSGGVGGATGGAGGAGGASGGNGGAAGLIQGGAGGVSGSETGGSAGFSVGGSAGVSGAGQGGSGGVFMDCNDPDATGGRGDGSTTKSTTVGTNGSFTDACDADGNLVEHVCEVGPCVSARVVPFGGNGGFAQGGSAGGAMCPTGSVVSRVIDCGGLCEEATCFGWCAEQGSEFEITGISGSNVLMAKGSHQYSCEVVFQGEGFDCADPDLVGRTLVVTSLGTCNVTSTTFGWNDPDSELAQECTFTCTVE